MANKILVGVETRQPPLDNFDEKIIFLTQVKNEIAEMKTSVDIGWLRVNVNPLIRELQMTINQWIDTYTDFLHQNTLKQMTNIQQFIEEVDDGIKAPPEKAASVTEKESLMKVMGHLRDVRVIKDRTFAQFEPMKQTIILLKKHGVILPGDEILVRLEKSKTKLNDVCETALGPVKEKILPL